MTDSLSVLTQHNDNGRSGVNLLEVLLNTTNVNQDEFGKLFTRHVDGHIYAQPLYLSNVPIPNKGTHNVVYVATMHNSVYAFDADDPHAAEPLWKASLGPSVPLSDPNIGPRNNLLPTLKPLLKLLVKNPLSFFSIPKEAWLSALRPIWEEFREAWEQGLPALLALMGGFNNISVEVGILSTPVISLTHNALYVVTLTKVENIYAHHLHALDLTTGADKFGGPVQLEASIPGTGIGSVNGKVAFISYRQIQRAALLLANDVVYIAFASYGDQDPYHGWVFAHNATTLKQVAAHNTTPDSDRGGIWMAGQGLAADSNNHIYFMTGNGGFQEDGSALGNSIVKLTPDLTLADWFAPFNTEVLTEVDNDVGSSGALLIPDTNLLLGGGKEGKFYLLDRDRLGHFNADSDSQIVQSFYVSKDQHIHGGPVYWHGPDGPWVYVWPENDFLKAYRLVDGQFQTTPVSQSTTTEPEGVPGGAPGMPGGILSISANGNTLGSGIVWASHPYRVSGLQAVVEGIVRAYDASDLTRELWNSKQHASRDDIGTFAKFCSPTIANGKVYMASFSGYLAVYGLLP